jgi:hypothetical protein
VLKVMQKANTGEVALVQVPELEPVQVVLEEVVEGVQVARIDAVFWG